jgi:hypothetical protein
LVEHATENRSVGGSIPPLGTTEATDLATKSALDVFTVLMPRHGVATVLQPRGNVTLLDLYEKVIYPPTLDRSTP